MFRYFKIVIRKFTPLSMQVPLKFWYSYLRGYSESEMALLKYLVNNETMAIDIGGYKSFYQDSGILHDASNFDPILLQDEENLNTDKKYINNFLFLHRDQLNKGEYKKILSMNL